MLALFVPHIILFHSMSDLVFAIDIRATSIAIHWRTLLTTPKAGLINLFVKHTSCALTVDMIHQYTLIARLVKSKIHYFALIKTIDFLFFWYKISDFLCKFAD